MQAVIMAGGKGTRVLQLTLDEIPKPMLRLCDKPIIQYQIENFKKNGINEIIIIVGHLGEKIIEYFGDGANFGVKICYIKETVPLGSAGALYYLKNMIRNEFILTYGDILFDIYINKMLKFHREKKSIATLLVHPNSHPYDSDIVIMDENNKIIEFDSKKNNRNYYYNNCVNSGIYIFNRNFLELFTEVRKTDLDKDILFKKTENNIDIYGYCSSEYVKDVGMPDRIKLAEKDIINNIVYKKNLGLPQKCIFLDRDGTINKYVGLLYNDKELELENYVIEALREINQSEYLAILISNQPVVARGLCNIEDVKNIHKKLQYLLGSEGVYLDKIEFCPHHPDKGYPEENKEYKIECECRKPKTGLIKKIEKDITIDYKNSWFVGDTTIDIQTGKNLNLKTALLRTGLSGMDNKYIVNSDLICSNLLEFIKKIKEEKKQ